MAQSGNILQARELTPGKLPRIPEGYSHLSSIGNLSLKWLVLVTAMSPRNSQWKHMVILVFFQDCLCLAASSYAQHGSSSCEKRSNFYKSSDFYVHFTLYITTSQIELLKY